MEAVLLILKWLLPVLSTVLTLIATAMARKWLKKLGLEEAAKLDSMIDDYVSKGVNAAERWANNQINVAIPGSMKKQKALSIILDELAQSGIRNVAVELLSNRIEAYLEGKEPGKSNGGT